LRHAVIWRKLSFGTQSARGSRFVETMLTVIETSRPSHLITWRN
jgi:transposase